MFRLTGWCGSKREAVMGSSGESKTLSGCSEMGLGSFGKNILDNSYLKNDTCSDVTGPSPALAAFAASAGWAL
jgi:hypothetical protein